MCVEWQHVKLGTVPCMRIHN